MKHPATTKNSCAQLSDNYFKTSTFASIKRRQKGRSESNSPSISLGKRKKSLLKMKH